LRSALRVDKYPLSVEKTRLWAGWSKKTESGPIVIRRAKALINSLESIGCCSARGWT
jgi:hypothetical protein